MKKTSADRIARNYVELMGMLYDIPKTKHRRHRSNFAYRGVADESWGLETSLQRLGDHYPAVERPLLRSFKKYAMPGEIPSNDLWFRLAVAQHHGLPTRLLDWSVAPKVALHFATCEEEHFDKDGAIWCVDMVRARDLVPQSLRKVLDDNSAFIFSIEMLEHIASLESFDRIGEPTCEEFLMFLEPPSLDARIINQGAVMSAMPGSQLDLKRFLLRHPGMHHRIIIPKELKWELRDKLDQDNVTERMLFPGLDGLSRWLKRYYGPGPNKKNAAGKTTPTPKK
jgi:hypothetical protein